MKMPMEAMVRNPERIKAIIRRPRKFIDVFSGTSLSKAMSVSLKLEELEVDFF
jgi:hypothetical protein